MFCYSIKKVNDGIVIEIQSEKSIYPVNPNQSKFEGNYGKMFFIDERIMHTHLQNLAKENLANKEKALQKAIKELSEANTDLLTISIEREKHLAQY